MTETKRPLKVFLCHASTDKPKVRELYRYLKRRGINPWFDEEHLVGGQDWQVEIPKALATSDAIIICLTKNSVDKEGYIQKEIKFALDKALEMPEGRIFLIPVKFEECEVPFSLSRYQWVDLTIESGYAKMMKALKFRASQLERSTVDVSKKDVEEDNLVREKEENVTVEKARFYAEEQVQQIAALEKTAREEGTREIAVRANRESAERQAARIASLKENPSRSFASLKSIILKAKMFLRIASFVGITIVLFWIGSWGGSKLTSLMPTAKADLTNTIPLPAQVINSTPSLTETINLSPIATPTIQPIPLGGGLLIFANGDLGNQDLFAIQGDGLGLTRLTSESGYIGYKWSGCDCSGTKSISGYNFVMDLSPNLQFLYYYYAPLGERKLRVVNMVTLKTIVDIFAPYGSSLAWSPDGTKMAFTEYIGEGVESLNVVDSDGQNLVKVEQAQQIDNIGWGMDDRILFFTESVCHNKKVTVNWGNWEYLSSAPVCDTSIRIADMNLQDDKVIYSSLLLQNGIKLNTSAVASNVSTLIAIPTSKAVVIFDYETHKEVESVSYPVKLQGYNIPKTPFWGNDGKLLFEIDNPYTKQEEIYEAIDGEFVIVTDEARLKEYDIIVPSTWRNRPLRYIGKDARNQDVYIQDINVLNPPVVNGHIISVQEINQQLNLSEFEYSASAISPDRNEIAMVLSRDDTRSVLVIYSLQDQQIWDLAGEVADYSNVTWSPDGKFLGFILQSDEKTAAVYVIDRNGTNMKRLSEASNEDLAGLFWIPFNHLLDP